MENIPHLRGNFLFGILPILGKNPLHYYSQTRDLGDIVKLDMGMILGTGYLISNPDYIYHVLHNNQKNYVKSNMYKKMAPILGNGLLLSEGSFWMRQRRLIQPSFRRKKIENNFTQIIIENTNQMLKKWESYADNKIAVNLCEEMSHLTLTIVLKSLFEKNLEEEMSNITTAWHSINDELGERFWHLFDPPKWFPSKKNKTFYKHLEILNKIIYRFIDEERQQTQRENLLTTLLTIEDADTGEKMTDEQIRDELITLFLAGHETSSNALSWLWYLLLHHPETESKLQQELESVLQKRTPTTDDLPNLPYNKMVIEETMRLYPPAWAISRNALEDDILGNYKISKGSFIFMSQYAMHRHPKYWEKPSEFYPEHFLEKNVDKRPRYTYFPFGGGGRVCIGNHFAMVEMQIIVAMILQKYQLVLINNNEIKPIPLATLNPEENILVHLQKK